jgi:anti-anti-sigma factor
MMNDRLRAEENIVNVEADERLELTELVRGSESNLIERIEPLVRRQSVALDLASVERIDAAGIAALISLYRIARESGHRFVVSKVTARVEEMLVLVGLDKILLSHTANEASHSGTQMARSAA